MARVVPSEEAEADLDSIDQYSIETWGGAVATDYMNGFDDAFARLADYPEIGPVFRAVRPPIRRLTYRSHGIFYDFDGETVTIIRILHHAMNAERILN